MKLAVSWGCLIQTEQYAYEMSVRETLPEFGVELLDLEGLSCCGRPMKSINLSADVYLSARNIALAEKEGLDLLAPCNSCNLSYIETINYLESHKDGKSKINELLKDEDLEYKDGVKIYHTIDLLHDVVGIEKIKEKVIRSLDGLELVSHTGCHLIRPSDISRVDDAENPQKLDELIRVLGAKTIDYPEKLDCCGGYLMVPLLHRDTALTMAGLKAWAIQERGVDALIDICPACQMMFDAMQETCGETVGKKINLPTLYFTQLLGLAMGIEGTKLGLHLNKSPIEKLLQKIEDK